MHSCLCSACFSSPPSGGTRKEVKKDSLQQQWGKAAAKEEEPSRSKSRDHRHSRSRDRDQLIAGGLQPGSGQRMRRIWTQPSPLFREKSLPEPLGSLSSEERDARTVLHAVGCPSYPRTLRTFLCCRQGNGRGRIISDRTRCSSWHCLCGVLLNIQSVPLAIGLTGQRLLGCPSLSRHPRAEKNRDWQPWPNNLQKGEAAVPCDSPRWLFFTATSPKRCYADLWSPLARLDSIAG
uniref:Uncharacterized protein n=1 Tax=Sphaerodactylus townsendi TaxID=933632 RepID=A0ACB8EXF6_9SAUR